MELPQVNLPHQVTVHLLLCTFKTCIIIAQTKDKKKKDSKKPKPGKDSVRVNNCKIIDYTQYLVCSTLYRLRAVKTRM